MSTIEITVPAGTYVLNDPCYAFPDEKGLDKEWNNLLHFEQAPIQNTSTSHLVLAFHTFYGDGIYDFDGGFICVDSGLIGLVDIEWYKLHNLDFKDEFILTCDEEFECSVDTKTGEMFFDSIYINTGYDENNDDNDEE